MWIPFRYIAPGLGEASLQPVNYRLDEAVKPMMMKITKSVNRVADRMPWKCKCLERAMATKYMLKRRRMISTLYLGVQKTPDKKLMAHAWVKSGDLMLTGSSIAHEFTVVSTFTC